VINIKNSATCFGSIEPPSGQIQDTYWYIQRVLTLWDRIWDPIVNVTHKTLTKRMKERQMTYDCTY